MLSVDIISGEAVLTSMSANANSRGMGQEAYHATSSKAASEAPKSFEFVFRTKYDARDEDSAFWTLLEVIGENFVQRRRPGALIMRTKGLLHTCR